MPRIVRTARGEMIDFDTIIIKNQLAQAPMNIEVARRKEFIDSKEGKTRGVKKPEDLIEQDEIQVDTVEVEPAAIVPTVTISRIDSLDKASKKKK